MTTNPVHVDELVDEPVYQPVFMNKNRRPVAVYVDEPVDEPDLPTVAVDVDFEAPLPPRGFGTRRPSPPFWTVVPQFKQ